VSGVEEFVPSEIIELYFRVKKLIIEAENVDPEKRIPLNSVNEMRNALDHLMRVWGKKQGLIENVDVDLNLQQAMEHIYRAGYDACDLIAISLFEAIDGLLRDYSSRAILQVIPDFYQRIYPKLEKLRREIEEAKVIKGTLEESFSPQYFQRYESIVKEVKELKAELEEKVTAIERVESELENSNKFQWKVSIVSALLGAMLGSLLTLLFNIIG
jgi:hypothetical protein